MFTVIIRSVLVDDRGEAQLADFGLAKLEDSKATTVATSFDGKGSVRWQAPELLNSGKYGGCSRGPSLSSDIYSFACLCIEVRRMSMLNVTFFNSIYCRSSP